MTKKKKTRSSRVNSSLLASVRSTLGADKNRAHRCQTCRDYPDIVTLTAAVLDEWIAEGARSGSWAGLHRSITRNTDYPLSEAAHYKHVRKCEHNRYIIAKELPCLSPQSK
jgi:hypothetical protein